MNNKKVDDYITSRLNAIFALIDKHLKSLGRRGPRHLRALRRGSPPSNAGGRIGHGAASAPDGGSAARE